MIRGLGISGMLRGEIESQAKVLRVVRRVLSNIEEYSLRRSQRGM